MLLSNGCVRSFVKQLEYHTAPKDKSFRLFGPGASCGPEIQSQAHFFGIALGNGELEAQVFPIEKKYSSCFRSCATASNLEHRRVGVAVWPLPPRERRAPPPAGGGRSELLSSLLGRTNRSPALGRGLLVIYSSAFRSAYYWGHRTCCPAVSGSGTVFVVRWPRMG